MKFIRAILFGAFLAFSCMNTNRPQPEPAEIAASVFPIADITQNLIGDSLHVQAVIPPGANPHTFDPQPALIRSLQSARLFIGVNPEFDGWIVRYLPSSCQAIFLENKAGDHEGHENPHIWLSVKSVRSFLPVIQQALVGGFPQHARAIEHNTGLYALQLDSVDTVLEKQFRHANKAFIQYHPAWDFLAKDYGLSILGTISKGHAEAGSIKEFESLIRTAREQNVHIIVAGLNEESPLIKALAREIDGTILRLNTLGDPKNPEIDAYLKLMTWNGKRLAAVLNDPVQPDHEQTGE